MTIILGMVKRVVVGIGVEDGFGGFGGGELEECFS